MTATKITLTAYVALEADPTLGEEYSDIKSFLLASTAATFDSAKEMLKLDSALMDVPAEVEVAVGFIKERIHFCLEDFENDDECQDKTRFTRGEITTIIKSFDLEEDVQVWNGEGNYDYYKFNVEELTIYMLRKMSTGRTNKDMADAEFGECARRWGVGYNYVVKHIGCKLDGLIGPRALGLWAPQFPYFAEVIRCYLHLDKERINHQTGETYSHRLRLNQYGEGDFNVFSMTDCTVYEFCRPGSGPGKKEIGSNAPMRKQVRYIKQCAFYDGYHRGMEACCKILTICLPNGMTAAVYGPTSG
jgi:hypothetical protein